jgi:hypothetical protein
VSGTQPESTRWVYMGRSGLFAYYVAPEPGISSQGTVMRILLPTVDATTGEVPAQSVPVEMVTDADGGHGSYHTGYKVFQSAHGESGLPAPLLAIRPDQDHVLWEPVTAPEGVPPSFRMADGSLWRLAEVIQNGPEQGTAVYLGPLAGQELRLQPPGADGYRLARLTDTNSGVSTQGTYNAQRGSILMRNGSLAYVDAADGWGAQHGNLVAADQLHTINADLDITGNVLSFGVLSQDAGHAGAVLQFQDRLLPDEDPVALLHSILARPKAEWLWSHASAVSLDQPAVPAMRLDKDHRLILYDDAGNESVIIDPKKPAWFSRGIRVPPGGDLPMFDYNQP